MPFMILQGKEVILFQPASEFLPMIDEVDDFAITLLPSLFA